MINTTTGLQILTITEEHQYIIESLTNQSFDGDSIGTMNLLNICTNVIEEFAIWIGDDDLSWFYVCLPTGKEDDDENELLEVYNIDAFGLQIECDDELNWNVSQIPPAHAWPV